MVGWFVMLCKPQSLQERCQCLCVQGMQAYATGEDDI